MTMRRKAREAALQILYRYDSHSSETGSQYPTYSALTSDLSKHFEHFQTLEKAREFAALLVIGTISKMAEIDAAISSKATHWKIERMAVIDRNLIRMSVYELLFLTDTPRSVVMDEAIELAKQFGSSESSSFINGILDSIEPKENVAP
jgi:N utilization substance protein B